MIKERRTTRGCFIKRIKMMSTAFAIIIEFNDILKISNDLVIFFNFEISVFEYDFDCAIVFMDKHVLLNIVKHFECQ